MKNVTLMLRCFKMSSSRVVLPTLGPSSKVIAMYGPST